MTTEPPPRAPDPRWWRRRGAVVAITLGVLLTVAGGPWAMVHVVTAADITGPGTSPRPGEAALVLGAGLAADGTPSPFLRERVEAAAQLYRDGRVKVLPMSGDNSRLDYDEVATMATIVVIDGGRVVEQGSHYELMAAGGHYARLFRLQAERFAAGLDAEGNKTEHAADPLVEEEAS